MPDVIDSDCPPRGSNSHTGSTGMEGHLHKIQGWIEMIHLNFNFKVWSRWSTITKRFDADDLLQLIHLVAEALGFLEGVDAGARGSVPDFHSSVIAGRDYEAILLRCNSVCCMQCNATQCLRSYAMLCNVFFQVLFFFSKTWRRL